MARPHNSKDKNRIFLMNRLKDLYGQDFDPIMRAAEQATRLHAAAIDADDTRPLKDSIDAWLKIGEFVMPKLKAVEHTVDDDTLIALKTIKSTMDYTEATQIYRDMLKSDAKELSH